MTKVAINGFGRIGRLVARAVAEGARLSLGSDGHTAEQVADVAWPLATARTCGARDADLYEPTAHGRRDPA